jgi:hypothetical protein
LDNNTPHQTFVKTSRVSRKVEQIEGIGSSGLFSQKSATRKAVARKKSLPKANNKNLETELNEYSEMNVEDIDTDPLLFWRLN